MSSARGARLAPDDYTNHDECDDDRHEHDQYDETATTITKIWIEKLLQKLDDRERGSVEGCRLRREVLGFAEFLLGKPPRFFRVWRGSGKHERAEAREQVSG